RRRRGVHDRHLAPDRADEHRRRPRRVAGHAGRRPSSAVRSDTGYGETASGDRAGFWRMTSRNIWPTVPIGGVVAGLDTVGAPGSASASVRGAVSVSVSARDWTPAFLRATASPK